MRPVVVSQVAPLEKLRRIHVWDDGFENAKDLQQHWADGKGCPGPFTFHPGAYLKFVARRDLLDEIERDDP